MSPRDDFVWETDVNTAALNSPREQLKASIFEGKLHVQVGDQQLEVDLPEDVFTDDAHAKLEDRKLRVSIGRRDPNGPAMQEKRMLNPDRHPVELDIILPKELVSKAKSSNSGVGTEGPGQQMTSTDELTNKLRDTAVQDDAPSDGKVLAGTKAHENDERAVQPAAAAAGAPAGDDEHLTATGQKGEQVRVDFSQNKVGMEYEELTAGDLYVNSDSKTEPMSSLKQPGAALCDLCACAPCQCHKMSHTGAGSNVAYEMTPAETKRAGKPAIHHPHREITGKNAHDAHDYQGHAKQVREDHARIGNKLDDYQGDVPEGVGDVDDPKYHELPYTKHVGATHTGGRPIEFGGPGKRHVSDQAAGGPVKGGAKTTFTTMG